jgi:hypothetical protein
MTMLQLVDERVDVPVNKNVFLEFAGLVFDTGFILEDELEDGRRASLDKMDRYFCATILSVFGDNGSSYIL